MATDTTTFRPGSRVRRGIDLGTVTHCEDTPLGVNVQWDSKPPGYTIAYGAGELTLVDSANGAEEE